MQVRAIHLVVLCHSQGSAAVALLDLLQQQMFRPEALAHCVTCMRACTMTAALQMPCTFNGYA